jgi:type VI secretion system protein ImpI
VQRDLDIARFIAFGLTNGPIIGATAWSPRSRERDRFSAVIAFSRRAFGALAMGLVLTIENEEGLPNGAPQSMRLGRDGGLDIGRGANQDWTLPDPSRFISSKHCEVRYRDDAYWLYDISANGTYLNESPSRLQAPHRLADGDRFMVGNYVIAVAIEPDEEPAPPNGAVRDTAAAALTDIDDWPLRAVETTPVEDGEIRVHDSAATHEPEPASEPSWHERAFVPPQDEHPDAAASGDEVLRRFAAGAGIPEQVLQHRDGLQFAEELGALFRLTAENLTQLLRARADIGRTAGVSSQTTVQALDNNPLKFSPSVEDALRLMLGPRTRGFLDAKRAIEGAFTDLKAHQVYTFSAMQQAVRMLVEDFDPKAIDAAAGQDHGLANLLQSRKAKLWDIYVARWNAQTLRHDDGLAGAFLRYFGQCFDEAKESKLH